MRELVIMGARMGSVAETINNLAFADDYWSNVSTYSKDYCDVTIPGHVRQVANGVAERSGKVDIVYCAGVNHLGAIGELEPTMVREQLIVNAYGFINVLDAFRRALGTRRTSVVAIVSDSSRVAMRGSIGYASSKAALAHAIRCAARELAPQWRVNGVSPGIIDDTPMTRMVDALVPGLRGWTPEEALAYERSLIPMGRRVSKQEVAELVLSTLKGPDFMTGSIIDIAGGK